MSKQRHQRQGKVQKETKVRQQQQAALQVITPGRAPAEGPAFDSGVPTHERWEQGTPWRDPVEGPDID